MEQELTLHALKPLLLQSDAENCSDALFLKKLFYNIIDESVMQKKLICKSASSLKAFMQGNRRRNRQQKRTYANYHGTKLLKEIFEIKERKQLFQNETLHQLAYNIDTMMAEAKISDWRAVQISIFKMLNAKMVYGSELLDDIKELYKQNKISRIIAVIVLISIFQETISDVFCWLTPKTDICETIPAIRNAAMQMLHHAAEEQGRMLAFQSVSHKIDMPGIGNLLSTALGVQNYHIDSILVENEQHNRESLRALFSNPPYPNIMLTGTGGAGKTFLLLDLGEFLLQKNRSLIPIYIPLNLLNYNAIGKQESPILHHFYQILSEEKQRSYEQFLSLLQTESDVYFFFLLDGYNEISSETAKNQLLLEIKEMKRNYPAIRFLITSRNNLADCFSTGGELPFLCKRVNPLQDAQIQDFFKQLFGTERAEQEWQTLTHSNCMDILRSPMALAMYAYTLKKDVIPTAPLPHRLPETTGELICNFIEQVKRTPTLNGTSEEREQTNFAMQMLYYIAYCMTRNGSFRMDEFSIRNAIQDAIAFYKTYSPHPMPDTFAATFWEIEHKMGFLIEPQHADQDFRFYHQNFRDYFYANFLLEIIQTAIWMQQYSASSQSAGQLLCRFFSELIPEEILQFLGESTLERLYLPGQPRMNDPQGSLLEQALQILSELPANSAVQKSIEQLIFAVKQTRHQNLSTFRFNDLHLETVNLNGIRLYDFQCNTLHTADFSGSFLNAYTFQPLGHSAAVHTFCTIQNNVLSISGSGIWCYNNRTRQFRFLSAYNGTYVSTSVSVPQHRLLLMGDKNGNLSFWSVSFQDKLLSIQQQPERTISLGNVIQHLLYDTAQDCCFAAIKGEGIWRIPLLHPENRKFVPYPEHCRNFRKYRLAAVEDVLIFSCGKTLYQIPMHAESFCSEQIQPFLTVSTQAPEPDDAFIYDFKVLSHLHQPCFLINLRGKSRSVVLLATPNGNLEIQRKEHTDTFNGFNDLILSPDASKFCICNKVYGNQEPCISEVLLSIFEKDIICKPYYGKQNFEIETACYLDSDSIMLSSLDRSLQIINTRTETICCQFLGYDAGIHSLFPVNENTLYTSSYDGTLHQLSRESWFTGSWHCVRAIPAHNNWVHQVKQFSIDGVPVLASCSHDHTIRIWNAKTETCICTISMPYLVIAVGFFPDGTVVGVTRNGMIGHYRIDLNHQQAETLSLLDLHQIPECSFARTRKLCMRKKADGTWLLFLLVWTANHTTVVYQLTENDQQELQLNRCCSMDELVTENVILRDVDVAFLKDGHTRCALFCGSPYQQYQNNFFALQTDQNQQYLYRPEADTPISVSRHDALDNYNGVTAGLFLSYQGELYAAIATYSYQIIIFAVREVTNAKIILKCVHDTPILDLQTAGNTLFAAGANGKVFQWNLAQLLPVSDTEKPLIFHSQPENIIFENVSGFFMNHVRFADSHTDWNEDFRKKIEQYAENS